MRRVYYFVHHFFLNGHRARQWCANVWAVMLRGGKTSFHQIQRNLLGLNILLVRSLLKEIYEKELKEHKKNEEKSRRGKSYWVRGCGREGEGIRVWQDTDSSLSAALIDWPLGLGVKAWGLTDCLEVINLAAGMDSSRLLSVQRSTVLVYSYTHTHKLNLGWVCYWISQMMDSCLTCRMLNTTANCSIILLLCPRLYMNNGILCPAVTHNAPLKLWLNCK